MLEAHGEFKLRRSICFFLIENKLRRVIRKPALLNFRDSLYALRVPHT